MKKPEEKTEREKLDDLIVKIKAFNLKLNKWFDLMPLAVQIIVPTALALLAAGLTSLVTVHWSIGFVTITVLASCSRVFYIWKQYKGEPSPQDDRYTRDPRGDSFTPGFHSVRYDTHGNLKGICSKCYELNADVATHVCKRPRGRFTR
jgi:hypothetical protein